MATATKRRARPTKPRGREEWVWMPHPAHFICAKWCRFHLATYVGGFIVSTVGEFVHPRHSGGSEAAEAKWLEKNYPGENIGCDRKYETFVFRAALTDKRSCCQYRPTGWGEIDSLPANDSNLAYANHMKLCDKWSKIDPNTIPKE